MTDFSAQPSCSVTSIESLDLSALDTITLTNTGSSYSSDTFVVDLGTGSGGGSSYYTINNSGSFGTITTTTIGGGGSGYGSGSINIGPITSLDFKDMFKNQEWKTGFPEWNRIQKMCEQYPGLKIAFEKFKTTYKLVQDDYDAPPEKRIKP
jgi:hypothetical protein